VEKIRVFVTFLVIIHYYIWLLKHKGRRVVRAPNLLGLVTSPKKIKLSIDVLSSFRK
jgi:hypothetical protein